MLPVEVEHLKPQFAGRQVLVDANRPELARWADTPGRVVTINQNGHVLVQFDGPDAGWHEIHPKFLEPT
ncbi:MAG: hypothetical protein LLF97_07650 [Planctomycetaceae bacterium]|nr:hypothetical protein [Planctomycetaceae bacterium]